MYECTVPMHNCTLFVLQTRLHLEAGYCITSDDLTGACFPVLNVPPKHVALPSSSNLYRETKAILGI